MIKKVLHVLNGERGLDTYPSVYNAMHILAENGWENHIFTGGEIEGFEPVIRNSHKFKGGYLRRAFQLSKLTGEFNLVILYEPRDVEIYQLSRLLYGRLKAEKLVHHSLEIPTELLRMHNLKGYVHRFLYRGYKKLDRVIIQDEIRGKLFSKYFPKLKNIKFSYISNSYLTEFEPIASELMWFDDIRKSNPMLVTYTGAIERWALSLDFIKEITKNKDVAFLFSGWSYDGFAQEAIDYCKNVDNIYFDLKIKSRTEFNYIVKNSDIGLAIYDSSDPNVAVIGLSSGKMHKFLSYGKPVVANNILSIKNFLETNGFGVACHEHDISKTLSNMFENYSDYTMRIKDKYSSFVDFRDKYNTFIKSL